MVLHNDHTSYVNYISLSLWNKIIILLLKIVRECGVEINIKLIWNYVSSKVGVTSGLADC